MRGQSACQPETPLSLLPVGRCDMDSEAGAEQPRPSAPMMTVLSPHDSFRDMFHCLFEEVRALKQSVTDFRRRASEIKQFRSELDDMKLKVDLLATGRSLSVQDVSSQCSFAPTVQVRKESLHSLEEACRDCGGQQSMLSSPLSYKDIGERELYQFNMSIWDISVFIGTPYLGLGGSAINCLLLLMSVMMQLVFVGIVWFNFTEAMIDESTVEAARRWRTNYAHDYGKMDLRSGFSLVARVCQNDLSLEIASSQESLYADLSNYLKPGASGLEACFVGKALCAVALVCWFLMVSKEWNHAFELFQGIMFLDRGPDLIIPMELPGDPTRLRVISMSRKRMIFSAILCGYRLILSGLLVYCGTFFLVYTIDITELVLNAVALEIVLKSDELLFDAATAAGAKVLLMKLEPLSTPRWSHVSGTDLKSVSMVVIVPGAAILVYHTMLSPMVDTLNEVSDALCGGFKDFVFKNDERRMSLFASTTPCTNGCDTPTEAFASVQNLAVWEVVKHGLRNSSEYALVIKHPWDYRNLPSWTALSFEDAVMKMSPKSCIDALQGPYLRYMREIMGNSSISVCNDVKYWCSSASFSPEWAPDGGKGLMARMLCPRTCECDNPGGRIIFSSGCPPACSKSTHPVFAQHLNASNHSTCSNRRGLNNSNDWRAWVMQLRQFSAFRKDSDIMKYAQAMMEDGCADIDDQKVAMNCKWGSMYRHLFKQVAYVCAGSCCHIANAPLPRSCPHSCMAE